MRFIMLENLQDDIKTVVDEWKKDSVVNSLEPSSELIRIPVLHSKYGNYLLHHSMMSERTSFEYDRMKKSKWRYYSGKMSQEELQEKGLEPFQFILKSDINVFIDGDEELTKILEKRMAHKEAAKYCENVMKELHSRTFQLKSLIEWEKFINGQS